MKGSTFFAGCVFAALLVLIGWVLLIQSQSEGNEKKEKTLKFPTWANIKRSFSRCGGGGCQVLKDDPRPELTIFNKEY